MSFIYDSVPLTSVTGKGPTVITHTNIILAQLAETDKGRGGDSGGGGGNVVKIGQEQKSHYVQT